MENPELRIISPKQFIMIDGQGVPDDVAAIAKALRRVVAAMKLQPGMLEAIWWTESGEGAGPADPTAWRWTLMMHPLGDVTNEILAGAIRTAQAEQNDPLLTKIRLETYDEGQVVQALYTGPLSDKQPRLEEMLAFALSKNLKPTGKYHEIYIDDPGPDAPPTAKTILRQPVV